MITACSPTRGAIGGVESFREGDRISWTVHIEQRRSKGCCKVEHGDFLLVSKGEVGYSGIKVYNRYSRRGKDGV